MFRIPAVCQCGWWAGGVRSRIVSKEKASYSWLLAVFTICRHEEVLSPRKMKLPSSYAQVHIKSQALNSGLTGKLHKVCPSCTGLPRQIMSVLGHQHLENKGGRGIKTLAISNCSLIRDNGGQYLLQNSLQDSLRLCWVCIATDSFACSVLLPLPLFRRCWSLSNHLMSETPS